MEDRFEGPSYVVDGSCRILDADSKASRPRLAIAELGSVEDFSRPPKINGTATNRIIPSKSRKTRPISGLVAIPSSIAYPVWLAWGIAAEKRRSGDWKEAG
jgi:hypothetical protein